MVLLESITKTIDFRRVEERVMILWVRSEIMVQKHLEEIRTTKEEIRKAKSKKRKYELTRHLRKLQKEYLLYKKLKEN